jgi:starch synthase
MPPDKLRVAIATTGRFHVLDLARELCAQGMDVAFYSMLPPGRARQFGLPESAYRLVPELIATGVADRLARQHLNLSLDAAVMRAANKAIIRQLGQCDIFIGMAGLMLEASEYAKARFGAKVFIERGSRHIESQAEILAAIPGAEQVRAEDIARDVRCYEIADAVVVPSFHAERSFTERAFDPARLFRNPYGVDLKQFRPAPAGQSMPENTVAFVGRWSLRKGVDFVSRVVQRQPRLNLLHAGAIGDYAIPQAAQFTSVGHVDQPMLHEIYTNATISVLPSKEEGLALVLAQSLACGVPIVCSDRSGGEDLKALIDTPDAIAIVPADDERAFERAVLAMLESAHEFWGRDLLGASGRAALQWPAYGKRYHQRLLHTMGGIG